MGKKKKRVSSPELLVNLLSQVFGKESNVVTKKEKTDTEWIKILNRLAQELEKYSEANVNSDEFHMKMIKSGLHSATHSLHENEEEFSKGLLGYVAGLIKFSFALIGEYPNHLKLKGGRKKKDHYNLVRFRNLFYYQEAYQKVNTLIYAYKSGFVDLEKDPNMLLIKFRQKFGPDKSYNDFLNWYKQNYPMEYIKIF